MAVGDEQRLTQVLLNLVGNAIKFTDTGEVRITAKAVNGHFNVTVADIPPTEQTRIFEQFHQVDSSLTKAKGGTGMGLAIAKQIVEMHGGRIWVESTLGKGSTFQMELPVRAQDAGTTTSRCTFLSSKIRICAGSCAMIFGGSCRCDLRHSEEQERGARVFPRTQQRVELPMACRNSKSGSMTKRILVVEDQEDLRGVLRDLLTGSGYAVAEAADGQAGVAMAKSERPGLILMDIQLPVMNGYEATRQIKADPGLEATPIIAVSSFAMKGDEEKARASGCDHYVTKPYSPLQLLRVIRGFLGDQA